MTGIVQFFNGRYGFVAPMVGEPDSTPNLYFSAAAILGEKAIPGGAEVEFQVVRGAKGPQCANVRLRTVKIPRAAPQTGEEANA